MRIASCLCKGPLHYEPATAFTEARLKCLICATSIWLSRPVVKREFRFEKNEKLQELGKTRKGWGGKKFDKLAAQAAKLEMRLKRINGQLNDARGL